MDRPQKSGRMAGKVEAALARGVLRSDQIHSIELMIF